MVATGDGMDVGQGRAVVRSEEKGCTIGEKRREEKESIGGNKIREGIHYLLLTPRVGRVSAGGDGGRERAIPRGLTSIFLMTIDHSFVPNDSQSASFL
jgi:hypothetical protein